MKIILTGRSREARPYHPHPNPRGHMIVYATNAKFPQICFACFARNLFYKHILFRIGLKHSQNTIMYTVTVNNYVQHIISFF